MLAVTEVLGGSSARPINPGRCEGGGGGVRALFRLPRQSIGKGCQKSICLELSKGITVFKDGLEAIYPLNHTGVVCAAPLVSATPD